MLSGFVGCRASELLGPRGGAGLLVARCEAAAKRAVRPLVAVVAVASDHRHVRQSNTFHPSAVRAPSGGHSEPPPIACRSLDFQIFPRLLDSKISSEAGPTSKLCVFLCSIGMTNVGREPGLIGCF